MRVYLSLLPADIHADSITPRSAWAVTDSLEASVGEESWGSEEFEAVALDLAAQACLEELGDSQPSCRVVAAADLDDIDEYGLNAGEVVVSTPVPLTHIVSLHIDEEDAWPLVAAALAGDDEDDALSEAALLWYDVSEIGLVRDILAG